MEGKYAKDWALTDFPETLHWRFSSLSNDSETITTPGSEQSLQLSLHFLLSIHPIYCADWDVVNQRQDLSCFFLGGGGNCSHWANIEIIWSHLNLIRWSWLECISHWGNPIKQKQPCEFFIGVILAPSRTGKRYKLRNICTLFIITLQTPLAICWEQSSLIPSCSLR